MKTTTQELIQKQIKRVIMESQVRSPKDPVILEFTGTPEDMKRLIGYGIWHSKSTKKYTYSAHKQIQCVKSMMDIIQCIDENATLSFKIYPKNDKTPVHEYEKWEGGYLEIKVSVKDKKEIHEIVCRCFRNSFTSILTAYWYCLK